MNQIEKSILAESLDREKRGRSPGPYTPPCTRCTLSIVFLPVQVHGEPVDVTDKSPTDSIAPQASSVHVTP